MGFPDQIASVRSVDFFPNKVSPTILAMLDSPAILLPIRELSLMRWFAHRLLDLSLQARNAPTLSPNTRIGPKYESIVRRSVVVGLSGL